MTNNEPIDVNLLRDLESLAMNQESAGTSTAGNIEIAAVRAQAVKSIISQLANLNQKRLLLVQHSETQALAVKNEIRELSRKIEQLKEAEIALKNAKIVESREIVKNKSFRPWLCVGEYPYYLIHVHISYKYVWNDPVTGHVEETDLSLKCQIEEITEESGNEILRSKCLDSVRHAAIREYYSIPDVSKTIAEEQWQRELREKENQLGELQVRLAAHMDNLNANYIPCTDMNFIPGLSELDRQIAEHEKKIRELLGT